MLISEVLKLREWKDHVESSLSVVSKLTKLQNVLNNNVNKNNNNQPFQAFTEQKNTALDAISAVDLTELSETQIACLNYKDASEYLGPEASAKLRETFRDEGHDLAHLLKCVQTALSAIQESFQEIDKVTNAFGVYAEILSISSLPDEQPRFSIIFKHQVGIETLGDFEARLKDWKVVMHGIGVALDIPPDDFKVLGARNGSIVIDLYIAAAAIVPIGFILVRSLNMLEQFAITTKRMKDIFTLDLEDPRFKAIEDKVQAASDEYFNISKKIAAKDISKQILDEINCEEGRREEADSFLQKSINRILNHLRKGGELDAYIPKSEEDDPDSTNEQAASLIREFREKILDSDIDVQKLLESFEFPVEEDNDS
ncbi:MAG: hypothetical protein GVY36_17065 [Verrucomicrobia bacterium]|jgi:dimeric dUTPase (all-alpha-NTP-PPase superfamily)|nr:hypothetical protein [Verrucomicrobiota bacterium]